jgi:hypothetical protein
MKEKEKKCEEDEKKNIKFMQRTVLEIKVFITDVHELKLTNSKALW